MLSKEFQSETVRLSQILESDVRGDGTCHQNELSELVDNLWRFKPHPETQHPDKYERNVADIPRPHFTMTSGPATFDPRPRLSSDGVTAFHALLKDGGYTTAPLSHFFKLVAPIQSISVVDPHSDEEKPIVVVRELAYGDLRGYGFLREPKKSIGLVYSDGLSDRFLKPYDVIVANRGGSLGKVTIVPPDVPDSGEGGWIAGGNFFVLRRYKGHYPLSCYLAYQLRTDIMMGVMSAEATKSILSKSSLLNFPMLTGNTPNIFRDPFEKDFDSMVYAFNEQEKLLQKIEKLESRADIFRNEWAMDRIR